MHRINLSDHWTPAGPGRWVRRFGRPRTLDPGETAWLVGTAAGDGTLTVNGQAVAELVGGRPFAADVTALLRMRNEAVIQGPAVGPVAMEVRPAS